MDLFTANYSRYRSILSDGGLFSIVGEFGKGGLVGCSRAGIIELGVRRSMMESSRAIPFASARQMAENKYLIFMMFPFVFASV
jgi:hypothetical protein